MASQRTIKVKRYHDIVNEYPAGGEILPGSVVALQDDGTVIANDTANAAATMVALEDELQGRTTRDVYEEDDPVQCWYVAPGEEVLLVVSDAFDPDIGTYLSTGATDGQVVSGTEPALFQVTGEKFVDDEDNHRVPARRV